MKVTPLEPRHHQRAARLLIGLLDEDRVQMKDVLDSAASDPDGRSGLVMALAAFALEQLVESTDEPADALRKYLLEGAAEPEPQEPVDGPHDV